jgi:hypothetical protein
MEIDTTPASMPQRVGFQMLLLRIQIANPILESIDPIDFNIRERTVEHREVIQPAHGMCGLHSSDCTATRFLTVAATRQTAPMS